MAVVEQLLASGALVAATTHYAELKTFAQDHPQVSNASVAFDVQTLRPTYLLEIGLPGKSQAFAIAERLGLPAAILADARSRLTADHVTMEETLAALARAQEERDAALAAAEVERAAAAAEHERARGGVSRARKEAAQILGDARRASDDLLARTEREVADIRRELMRQRNLAGGQRSRTTTERAFDDLATRAAQRRAAAPEAAEEPPEEGEATTLQPRVGLWGRSRTLGRTGRIVEISGRTGRVTLETDGPRVVVPADDVEVVPEPAAAPDTPDRDADELRSRAAARIASRLDLRGERVEAALERLAEYVDTALLAGLDEAVIFHGAGTGALRRAIREWLAEHPRVRGVRTGRRDEGGDGATVAQL
jgi:DNA mismatch repair protein MutS2